MDLHPDKGLADGTHTFTVVATDAIGNQSVISDGYTVTIATTLPLSQRWTLFWMMRHPDWGI
jgi:hypothetical protein